MYSPMVRVLLLLLLKLAEAELDLTLTLDADAPKREASLERELAVREDPKLSGGTIPTSSKRLVVTVLILRTTQ